ncbi:High-affinity zinc uptake system protein ZnuA [Defluviimonas aquaemixtae]|uniref:High-affinity zinc uptake system protein ZnuA n=1 Tax=Albidovulum aquaemixtae TaxID=1542388 RepID=A0A2R8BM82_9RHOB|nr:zinc ABC transporter substrate-binding protein [Defluviimonas aquaemixtae]SPH24529.1 High-affinity zinc uptake system protein ZnuA [Defluviimonas aquaemixtae]
MRRRPLTIAITVAALCLGTRPGQASAPEVATDMPVVHSLVSMVMGDIGHPRLLLESGADPHDFQLRPSQVSALQGADLVIWIGPEMTPWLDRALAAASGPATLALLHQKGTTLRTFGDNASGGDSEGLTDGDGHQTDGDATPKHDELHGSGALDPHAWLDPQNAALWIGLITDALVEKDPGNAVAYRANASLALMRVETLERGVAERLARFAEAGIVVAHDGYGYFADYFGLNIVAAVSQGDATEPGAARRVEVRELLKSGEVTCIFPEAGRDAAPMTTLAEGAPVRMGDVLDPEGLMLAPGPDLYTALLTRMAETIAKCVGDS